MELEQNAAQFKKMGLNVAGVSYDSIQVLHTFAERKGIHFPLLSDPDSKIIRQLGILNEQIPANSPFFGIPNPGTYIVNAKGVIEAKYFEDDYKQRFTGADILVQRYGVMPESTRIEVEGKQLNAAATASNSLVRTGQRIALVLDLDLKPNMHVYAPGVQGYIPVEWKVKESDAWIVHPATYPPSENLFLKAINETVPVYKGHFRLTRDITIGPDAKIQPLLDVVDHFSVEGTFRYQACDDHMCYIPQELPVRWSFQYEKLDRERVPAELQRKARPGSSQ